MPTYEITLLLVIECTCKVLVEADSPQAALDTASAAIPMNAAEQSSRPDIRWKAAVTLKAPKGVRLTSAEARTSTVYASSGSEKARKLS
jgi:hypothetical protein